MKLNNKIILSSVSSINKINKNCSKKRHFKLIPQSNRMDFFDSINLMILAQQFYRLALFRVDNKNKKIVTEKFQYFCSFFVISAMLCEFAYCGHLLLGQESIFPEKNRIFSFIFYMEVSLTITSAIFFLFNAVFKRRSQMDFYEKIWKIDENLLSSFKISVNYGKFKKNTLVALSIVLVYYNVLITSILIKFGQSVLNKSFTINSWIVIYIYVMLACCSGIFTHGYVGCVILVYQRSLRLGIKIEEIVRREREKVQTLMNFRI